MLSCQLLFSDDIVKECIYILKMLSVVSDSLLYDGHRFLTALRYAFL